MSKAWFYQLMGTEFGPLNSVELRQKVTRGEITPDTPIRMGNSSRWVDASQIKGLFDSPVVPVAPPPSGKTDLQTSPDIESSKFSTSQKLLPSKQVERSESTEDELLDDHAADEEYEFFKFVGFRQALSETLYTEVDAFRLKKGWTMTQITRRALAEFVGKPELAEDQPQATEEAPHDTEVSD